MRLSEKSIELNFCRQFGPVLGNPAWWFGATQKQEKEAGWDVATNTAGTWLLFQLKASNYVLKSGARRFRGHHHQLVELQARATQPLRVFYVFPTLGNTAELTAAGFDLLANVRFLDVSLIPAIPAPTKADGTPRKSELHNFDLEASLTTVTIRSEPVEVEVFEFDSAIGADIQGSIRQSRLDGDDSGEDAESVREFLGRGRHRVAVFVPSI